MLALFISVFAFGDFQPEKIRSADQKKTEAYLKNGLVIGGHRGVELVTVKDLRFSQNKDFERIVIDLEGSFHGEALAIPRPPYYQVEIQGSTKQLALSLWGKPQLEFDAKKWQASLKKSHLIQESRSFPTQLDGETWLFTLKFKKEAHVEVFELQKPCRMIIDLKGN